VRAAVVVLLVAEALGTFLGAGGTRGEPVKPDPEEPKLWSAISISRPVFDPYTFNVDRPKVRIHLGLVNDGKQVLETGLRESVLVVDGQPRRSAAWDAALKDGLRGNMWEKLPPGEHTVVACSLDDVITEPGVYRVSWRGKDFQSPEVVYRIIPRHIKPKPAAPQAAPKPDSPKEAQGKLWAVISIVPPVSVRDPSNKHPAWMELSLANDGTQTVETGAEVSVLVVNGQPWKTRDWLMPNNGPGGPELFKLPPGGYTGFLRPLGWMITDPGIYRVSWRGKNFQSPEVVYRMIKAKPK
jgi:hypothetical protein